MTLSCKTKCPQALVIALFLLLPLAAQDPGPRLEGLVLDPAKASIEGAKVEIVAENGVRPASLRTSSDGRFATAVAPGAYSILVSADGFQT